MAEGTWPELWAPCVALAHAFAGVWLLQALLLLYPGWWTSLKGHVDLISRKLLLKSRKGLGAQGHANSELVDDATSQAAAHQALHVQLAQAAAPCTAAEQYIVLPPGAAAAVAAGAHTVLAAPAPATVAILLRNKQSTSLEWMNIGCSYNTSLGMRTVLQGVYGSVQPGEMMALLGPSGSGKPLAGVNCAEYDLRFKQTTLLDILALRKNSGNITGSTLINGMPYTRAHLKQTAYVAQDDNFPATLRCEEVLRYWASMVLPADMPAAQRSVHIQEVLMALGLYQHRKTLVGGDLPGGMHLRGLSGGERKRLAVAAGILSAPSLLFIDEPTSGLDSSAALTVMQYMRAVSDAGHAVIASIHQPRTSIWRLFDTVLVLSDGRMLYVGSRVGMAAWFHDKLCYPYNPQLHGAPAHWVMDLVNTSFAKPQRFFSKTMTSSKDLEAAAATFLQHHLQQQQQQQLGTCKKVAAAGQHPDAAAAAVAMPAPDGMVALPQNSWQAQDLPAAACSSLPSSILCHPRAADVRVKCSCGTLLRSLRTWLHHVATLSWREYLLVTRNPADVAGRVLTYCWAGILVGLFNYNLQGGVEGLRAHINLFLIIVAFFGLLPFIYLSMYINDKRVFIADAVAGSNTLIRFSEATMYWVTYLRYFSVMGFSFSGLLNTEFKQHSYSCTDGVGNARVLELLPAYLPRTPGISFVQGALAHPGPDCTIDTQTVIDFYHEDTAYWKVLVILAGYFGVVFIASYFALLMNSKRDRR